jgi:hypothetical protein
MTAIDPKYVSLLWAGPEQAAEIAKLHAQVFGARRASRNFWSTRRPRRSSPCTAARRERPSGS